jgi:leucyl aminopeptidase
MFNTIQRAKDLAMTPANVATPMCLAKRIKSMFQREKHVRCHLYDTDALTRKKCGLILAVGQSAKNKPCVLTLERPAVVKAESSKTVCLVGKGVSFDSGGLSLKSFEGMVDMKYDKIGAVYIAHLYQLLVRDPAFEKHHIVAVLPFAENAVSAAAVHPGDVITSYSGKTVEITDPDAEGRLLLADAFGIAGEYKPDVVMDLATLTGHSDSINCWHKGYVYCQPESLRFKIEKFTNKIGERMLTMPCWPEYATVLKSNVADYTNSPMDCDDAFTAALFLREFLPKTAHTWIHVDLAHEFDDHVPAGNGIRALHTIAHQLLGN